MELFRSLWYFFFEKSALQKLEELKQQKLNEYKTKRLEYEKSKEVEQFIRLTKSKEIVGLKQFIESCNRDDLEIFFKYNKEKLDFSDIDVFNLEKIHSILVKHPEYVF